MSGSPQVQSKRLPNIASRYPPNPAGSFRGFPPKERRFLLPWIGGEKPAFRSLYGKGVALLIAVLLWNLLHELLLAAAPKVGGSAHAPAFPWDLIAVNVVEC